MKYVWLIFEYQPRYHYGGLVYEGHYKTPPKVFANKKLALEYRKKYIHASYMRKIKIHDKD